MSKDLTPTVTALVGLAPVVGQFLPLVVQLLAQYRSTRDALAAAGVSDSGMLNDQDLFDLLQHDAEQLVAHSNDLIKKWSSPQ